ncbi:hypothetical protein Chor_006300 [Crotalus horridus]
MSGSVGLFPFSGLQLPQNLLAWICTGAALFCGGLGLAAGSSKPPLAAETGGDGGWSLHLPGQILPGGGYETSRDDQTGPWEREAVGPLPSNCRNVSYGLLDDMDFKLKAGTAEVKQLNIQPYRLVHYEINMVSRKPSDLLLAFLPKGEDRIQCIFTAVDPDTGIMGEKEILKALKSYRKCDPSEEHIYNPPFGWLYGIEEMGILEVGDPVYNIIS